MSCIYSLIFGAVRMNNRNYFVRNEDVTFAYNSCLLRATVVKISKRFLHKGKKIPYTAHFKYRRDVQ